MLYRLHFARGESGDAVVAAYDNQGVVQLADFFQALDDALPSPVSKATTFAEVVIEVLAYVVDIG